MPSSNSVQGFYSGKNLFITGASGFLGICLLEKILRTIPDHGDIYLLVRPKKGKGVAERLEEIKKNQIFEVLLKDRPIEKIFARVKTVAGDVGQENLGLSSSDRRQLTDNVNIIFHSAATLDFGDTLKTTVDINLLGTRRVLELAKKCSKLKALVHISSAYVNSWRSEADEVIYPLKRDPEDVIAMVNKLTPEELEIETPRVLGDHPNTYTITKHMAELEVQKVEKLFPCTIVRPSMIIGSWKEPVPGWTISKNGPQGFFMGASKGVIRRLPVGKHLIYDYIPVDIVVNNILAAGYFVAMTKPETVAVYHCTSSTRNPFNWASIEEQINEYLHKYPLKSAVWYPHLKLLPSVTWYKISAFFVHFLPAVILDAVTKVAGGRPILVKLHRNVNMSLDRLAKFIFTEWKFSSVQTKNLQAWLNENDRVTYNLDIGELQWKKYFYDLTLGSRVYLSKDPVKTLPSALSKDKILMVVHMIWQAALLLFSWYILACITRMTMLSSIFIFPPVLFILYTLL